MGSLCVCMVGWGRAGRLREKTLSSFISLINGEFGRGDEGHVFKKKNLHSSLTE